MSGSVKHNNNHVWVEFIFCAVMHFCLRGSQIDESISCACVLLVTRWTPRLMVDLVGSFMSLFKYWSILAYSFNSGRPAPELHINCTSLVSSAVRLHCAPLVLFFLSLCLCIDNTTPLCINTIQTSLVTMRVFLLFFSFSHTKIPPPPQLLSSDVLSQQETFKKCRVFAFHRLFYTSSDRTFWLLKCFCLFYVPILRKQQIIFIFLCPITVFVTQERCTVLKNSL